MIVKTIPETVPAISPALFASWATSSIFCKKFRVSNLFLNAFTSFDSSASCIIK